MLKAKKDKAEEDPLKTKKSDLVDINCNDEIRSENGKAGQIIYSRRK